MSGLIISARGENVSVDKTDVGQFDHVFEADVRLLFVWVFFYFILFLHK